MIRPRLSKSVPGLARAVEFDPRGRVFLRGISINDVNEYIALRRRTHAFLKPWEPKPPRGIDFNGQSGFQRMLKGRRSPSCRRFFVCRADDGCIMGSIGLNQIFRGPFQSCVMGYWIGKEFTRQGYMREAVLLALRHAFHALKLHRVEANIVPDNHASLALIRSCGFRFEGLAKNYLQINGRWRDHEHWAMTLEDWIAPRMRKLRRVP
ncbi:MAG TPA: GNAT family protein [Phycisphaerales bacterium]|nr:GNAT family protein [Phycisphaerales bacterium]